jgi:hypothetical protein
MMINGDEAKQAIVDNQMTWISMLDSILVLLKQCKTEYQIKAVTEILEKMISQTASAVSDYEKRK